MDLSKVLAQLHAELANLDAAIHSLERLQLEGTRRGRPPKLLASMKRMGRERAREASAGGGTEDPGENH